MKRYYQDGFRIQDGDVIIHQYKEVTLPSGLIYPTHISTVSVVSPVTTKTLVGQMGTDFFYEAEPSPLGIAIVDESRRSPRFSVGPLDSVEFCRRSSQTIADAYKLLMVTENEPRIQLHPVEDAGDIAEDDHRTLQALVQKVQSLVVHGVSDESVADGMYL